MLVTMVLASPGLAQYREYYVRGRVVDAQKKPLPDVEIALLDASTSRRFHMKTDQKGEFKFAGLPHASYEVTFAREGYVTAKDTWEFNAPQERMQKVEVPDVVLASQAQVQEVQRLEGAKAGVEEAAEKLRKGDLDGAISTLEKVLEKNPQDPNALFYLGLGYVGKKRYAEAVVPLTRVTELTPAFPGAYFELGVCYRALGDPKKALELYDKNLQLDPDNAHSLYNSGLILFETNRVDEALVRFERGLVSRPDDAELLEMTGRCYVHDAKFPARGGAPGEGPGPDDRPRQARLPRRADPQRESVRSLTTSGSIMAQAPAPGGRPSEIVVVDGRVYHLGLLPSELARELFVVGDPARAYTVASRFDRVDHEVKHREFVTLTGSHRGLPVSVLGTGIGPDNVEIALVEAWALATLDLATGVRRPASGSGIGPAADRPAHRHLGRHARGRRGRHARRLVLRHRARQHRLLLRGPARGRNRDGAGAGGPRRDRGGVRPGSRFAGAFVPYASRATPALVAALEREAAAAGARFVTGATVTLRASSAPRADSSTASRTPSRTSRPGSAGSRRTGCGSSTWRWSRACCSTSPRCSASGPGRSARRSATPRATARCSTLRRSSGRRSTSPSRRCTTGRAPPPAPSPLSRLRRRAFLLGFTCPPSEGAQAVVEPRAIAHFDLIERLGAGGMGVVYRARDRVLGRDVALKLVRPEHAGDASARQRFLREARAAATLSHAGIAAVYEAGEAAADEAGGAPALHRRGAHRGGNARRAASSRSAGDRGGPRPRRTDGGGPRRGARAGHRAPRRQAVEPDGDPRRPAQGPRLRPRSPTDLGGASRGLRRPRPGRVRRRA